MGTVKFLKLAETDRDMLRVWLSSPHAQKWWGEVDEELRLIYAIEDGEHEPYIAYVGAEAVAYIQAWWPTKHADYPWQHKLTATTRGIDITIGPEKYLSKGYGTLIMKHFAAKLFAEGATRLVIDPEVSNLRAIQCYMKAGFTPYDQRENELLMELLPEDIDYNYI